MYKLEKGEGTERWDIRRKNKLTAAEGLNKGLYEIYERGLRLHAEPPFPVLRSIASFYMDYLYSCTLIITFMVVSRLSSMYW